MNADFAALPVSSQFVPSTLTPMFHEPSPSEGLGAARAATERASKPLVLAPKVSIRP